jgi:hypothetical protein
MVSYKFLATVVLGIAMVGMVFSAGMNSCGTVGDKMPAIKGDCNSDKNITEGAKCCYINAKAAGVSVSACTLLPKGVNITVIEEAAKALGTDATFDCKSNYVAVSTLLAFLFALLF